MLVTDVSLWALWALSRNRYALLSLWVRARSVLLSMWLPCSILQWVSKGRFAVGLMVVVPDGSGLVLDVRISVLVSVVWTVRRWVPT